NGAPAPVDIDGDGDQDMFIGREDGTIRYYENTSEGLTPEFVDRTGTANPLDGIDVDYFSSPVFVDLDDDDDFDAIVGGVLGRFAYFENTGSIEDPVFEERTG